MTDELDALEKALSDCIETERAKRSEASHKLSEVHPVLQDVRYEFDFWQKKVSEHSNRIERFTQALHYLFRDDDEPHRQD